MSLKEAVESAQRKVADAPAWLRRIYAMNDALDRRRRATP
jgi:hypothetical protein